MASVSSSPLERTRRLGDDSATWPWRRRVKKRDSDAAARTLHSILADRGFRVVREGRLWTPPPAVSNREQLLRLAGNVVFFEEPGYWELRADLSELDRARASMYRPKTLIAVLLVLAITAYVLAWTGDWTYALGPIGVGVALAVCAWRLPRFLGRRLEAQIRDELERVLGRMKASQGPKPETPASK